MIRPAAPRSPLPPPVIATVGLHASASTWVFNVVRELVASVVGPDQMLTFYADELVQLPTASAMTERYTVFKSHHGSHELDAWLRERHAPVLLSLRDPRDACLSMSQRFRAPLQHSVQWIARDCQRMARLAGAGYPCFRYEDRFFEERRSIDLLSDHLGVGCVPEVKDGIFARYRIEAVRCFAQKLDELPPARLTMVGGYRMDRLTQVLAPHIGDARVGKWRELPPRIRADLTRHFRPFLDQFGYAA